MIDHFLKTAATLVRRSQTGTPDRYGTPTWAETTSEVLTWLHPVSSEEKVERPAGEVKHLAYFAAGVEVGTVDRLIVAGYGRLEVAAPPRQWKHPTWDAGYQVCEMVEVDEVGS